MRAAAILLCLYASLGTCLAAPQAAAGKTRGADGLTAAATVVDRSSACHSGAAIVMLLDKSRSAMENHLLDSEKAASTEVIKNVLPSTELAVIGFDHAPFLIVPLQQMDKAGRERAASRLDYLVASGQSNLLIGIAEARHVLKGAKASCKRIVVLTDGKLPDYGDGYRDEASSARSAGIELSTFVLGDDQGAISVMKSIATAGGGSAFQSSQNKDYERCVVEYFRKLGVLDR